ncbi:hypothetical protein ERJ75_001411800 [Trypanosoma vivax]|uniref:Uncharacterized protein n=1 Tax=Trypanosoma vivax (strain Y486) TaxID=1055687 RepID=G0TUA9_TRYVY|nr:hypothetical protein ERJ75_001411800 [Trypanosoma vivax]CCC47543.1 hypothetical protein TVY486_0402090 [Trypanosoma vivax Y486]
MADSETKTCFEEREKKMRKTGSFLSAIRGIFTLWRKKATSHNSYRDTPFVCSDPVPARFRKSQMSLNDCRSLTYETGSESFNDTRENTEDDFPSFSNTLLNRTHERGRLSFMKFSSASLVLSNAAGMRVQHGDAEGSDVCIGDDAAALGADNIPVESLEGSSAQRRRAVREWVMGVPLQNDTEDV